MAAPEVTSNPVVVQNQTPTPPPPQKKSGKLKFVVIILVVLLVVILSELGYLIFSGYGRTFFELPGSRNEGQSVEQQETINQAQPEETLAPQPTVAPIDPLIFNYPNFQRDFLNPDKVREYADTLDGLKDKYQFVQRGVIELTFAGEISEISSTEAKQFGDRILPYKVILSSEGETLSTFFSQEEIENAEIYLIPLSEEPREAVFSDMQTGDFLELKYYLNALDSSQNNKLIFRVTEAEALR